MSWRELSASVIEKAIPIVEQRATDTIEIFDIIRREYYPFGERKMWPYKAWLSAIKQCKAEYHMKMFPKPHEQIDYDTGLFNKEA